MNSKQRKQLKKKQNRIANKFAQALEEVISRYGKDDEVITVADLRYVLTEIKENI